MSPSEEEEFPTEKFLIIIEIETNDLMNTMASISTSIQNIERKTGQIRLVRGELAQRVLNVTRIMLDEDTHEEVK